MSMAPIHSRFSRKTLGVAIATAVATGGVTIPQANAIGGHDYQYMYWHMDGTLASEQVLEENNPLLMFPEWGLYNGGGVYNAIPISADGQNTVAGIGGQSTSGMTPAATVARNEAGGRDIIPYATSMPLNELTITYSNEDPQAISMDSKKVLYAVLSIAQEIDNAGGLTEDLKQRLIANGYTGDFTLNENDTYAPKQNAEFIGANSKDFKSTPEELLDAFLNSDAGAGFREEAEYLTKALKNGEITQEEYDQSLIQFIVPPTTADKVVGDIATLVGMVQSAHTNARYFVEDPTNVTFDDIENISTTLPPNKEALADEDSVALRTAVINMARQIPDETINNSNVVVRYVSREYDPIAEANYPLIMSLTESETDKVSVPETTTPSEELHVTNVEKQPNGDYLVTRNDGETWTIELKDIRDKIAELETKDAPSRDEFNNVKNKIDNLNKDVDNLKAADERINTEIEKLKNDVAGLDTRLGNLENRVTNLENASIKEVRDNGDGTYTLIRNDGSKVTGTIDTSGAVTNITTDGKGNLIVTTDGKDQTVPLDKVTITEANKGTPNHTITITVPGEKPFTFNVYDTYVTDIKKNDEGDYDVYRSDVKGVWKTIKFDKLREEIKNLKGKDAKQDERLNNLENKLNDANDDLDNLANKVAKNEGAIEDHRKTIGDILVKIGNVEGDITNIKDELTRLDGQDIKEVRDNGDGTYTLIRNNGDEVKADIGSSETVTGITPNKDGSITIHKIDGSNVKVDLAKVKITEANKGTPNHTITITVPGEKPFTFNAYDNYIVDVKRENNGNYTVVRRDGESWEINLKDIRDRITALEDKDSPTRAEFDKVKKDLANLTNRVDAEFTNIDNRFTKVEGDITNLRNDLTALENRVTKVEARLTKVEGRTDAITKCLYGTGMAAIPAALGLPLALMTQIQIPGIAQLNADIQRQIGIYNEDLAKMWGQYGGVLQAAAAVSVLAGMIGGLAYITNECKPLTQTDAAQATDLGQLSSKLEQRSSRNK